MWLYLLLLKVKSDHVSDVNMDTSALFHSGMDVFGEVSDNFHTGDLNVAETLVDDKDGDIVLTVGECVQMYNNEENTDSDVEIINPAHVGKQKFERLQTNKGSKQTQSEIAVDFRDVAGRRGHLFF